MVLRLSCLNLFRLIRMQEDTGKLLKISRLIFSTRLQLHFEVWPLLAMNSCKSITAHPFVFWEQLGNRLIRKSGNGIMMSWEKNAVISSIPGGRQRQEEF